MPNRLTPLYSKIYYKEENYLKVRTAVFKYITPPIIKVEYISMLIYLVYRVPNISTFLYFKLLLYTAYITRPIPHFIVLLAQSVPYLIY